MTTEIKPGKWRLKDGREVVVLSDADPYGFLSWRLIENAVTVMRSERFEGAEYLGSEIIGDESIGRALAMLHVDLRQSRLWADELAEQREELESQCRDLEADMVATRELLEKSEERCEELQAELGIPIDSEALKAAERDEIEVHRYKSVTVMVRGEREMCCTNTVAFEPGTNGAYVFCTSREHGEKWCRDQLEPRWREAGEGDVGKACRVRDSEGEPWDHDRTLVGRHEDIVGGPWATVSSSGSLSGWRYCEVQD